MAPLVPVLLYDGECRLCRFCAATVAASDRRRRLGILPFADPEATPLLEGVPPEERYASMHLVFPDGRVVSGGDALTALVGLLGGSGAPRGTRGPAALSRLVGGAYRTVAGSRGAIGRFVPDVAPTRRLPG